MAIALPALVVGPVVWLERWRARGSRPAWSVNGLDLTIAAGIGIVIVAPWFALATGANGWRFLRDFFVGENVDRFLTDRFNPAQPAWYYGPVIAGGLLPWSPFLLLLVQPLVSAVRRRA